MHTYSLGFLVNVENRARVCGSRELLLAMVPSQNQVQAKITLARDQDVEFPWQTARSPLVDFASADFIVNADQRVMEKPKGLDNSLLGNL